MNCFGASTTVLPTTVIIWLQWYIPAGSARQGIYWIYRCRLRGIFWPETLAVSYWIYVQRLVAHYHGNRTHIIYSCIAHAKLYVYGCLVSLLSTSVNQTYLCRGLCSFFKFISLGTPGLMWHCSLSSLWHCCITTCELSMGNSSIRAQISISDVQKSKIQSLYAMSSHASLLLAIA